MISFVFRPTGKCTTTTFVTASIQHQGHSSTRSTRWVRNIHVVFKFNKDWQFKDREWNTQKKTFPLRNWRGAQPIISDKVSHFSLAALSVQPRNDISFFLRISPSFSIQLTIRETQEQEFYGCYFHTLLLSKQAGTKERLRKKGEGKRALFWWWMPPADCG